MPTVSFKTIGCRLNQAETARISGQFLEAGYEIVPFGKPSDVVIIHTCTVTNKAEKDSVRYARSAARGSKRPIIVLAGCAVEADREKIKAESGADIVVGQKEKYGLPSLIEGLRNIPLPGSSIRTRKPAYKTAERKRAIVKVQDGCDFRCSYCIVPKARGAHSSRPFNDIIDEVNNLSDNGFKEIVLTGANLGCYNYNNKSLLHLIDAIEDIDDVKRIRLSSIEISTVERAIIEKMAISAKLCRMIHLPLQSGDDKILAAMERRYDSAQYFDLVRFAIEKIPLLGLGTDIIVGFPGEDDRAFVNTEKLIKELPFSNLHIFQYSKREGTRAAGMENHIPSQVKKQRSTHLIRLGEMKRQEFMKKFIGKPISVLIEDISSGYGTGWTAEYLEAKIEGKTLQVNDIVDFTPSAIEDGYLV